MVGQWVVMDRKKNNHCKVVYRGARGYFASIELLCELGIKTLGTLLWVNPHSRSGDQDLQPFIDALKPMGEVYAYTTSGSDELGALIKKLGNRIERIVIGGGDGTVHHCLPAIVESGLPFGVIPLGTGNDFARSLNIPLDPESALDVIKENHITKVDLGKVNNHWFLNAFGLGLGPELTKKLDKETKSRLGVLAYIHSFLQVLTKRKSHRVKLTLDNKRIRTRFIQITVANGIHYGGGMTIAKDASLHDGRLRILIVKPQGTLALLKKVATFRWGADHNEPKTELTLTEAAKVHISTRKAYDVSVDGELETKTPITCECVHHAVQVFVPS